MDIKNAKDLMVGLAQGACAWPGGYPLVWLMADGECICPTCAKSNRAHLRIALSDKRRGNRPDVEWLPVSLFIHDEGLPIYCASCNGMIESAYGDPDAPETKTETEG